MGLDIGGSIGKLVINAGHGDLWHGRLPALYSAVAREKAHATSFAELLLSTGTLPEIFHVGNPSRKDCAAAAGGREEGRQ